jgi:hypothetical protein
MASQRKRVELSVADVRTPVTDGVAPPASRDPTTLPFRARSWQDFERILLQYAEHVDGLRSVRIYGVLGQAQHGIDLYGTDPAGETVAYQSKNTKTFTAASLRAAMKKFNDEPPPLLGVSRLVVCTACRTDDKNVGEELAKQRKANPKLKIDLYDERTLSEGLRGRPDLVRRLFGAAWQVRFCEDHGWEVPDRTPIDALADSLVRGPLVAYGLVDGLNQADALADTDPGQAAELVGHVIDRVAAEGFPGTTGTLRRQRAELLVAAGQIDEAASVLAELAWADRTNAGVDDDPQAEARLRALAKEHKLPTAKLFVDAIDAVDRWHQLPQADLDVAADLSLQLDAAGHPLTTELVLWVAETAVADRQMVREGPLIDAIRRTIAERASAGLADELCVRLRIAAADLGGDWTGVLRDARAGWLGARMATLVHARYGRHLYLHGQPDDAQVEYSAAVQVGCQAQLGNEAADALYSITQVRARYGPLDGDINALPRMAIDLRRQGHTAQLLAGRDPADAGAEALANGKLPSAFRRYRAAIRHAVIRGDVAGELNAHHRVADILLRSGEPVAAVPHIIRCGSSDLVKELTFPGYVDVRGDVLEGAHWERATALNIVAGESDSVPDNHLNEYVTVALAATSEPYRSPFGPHVSVTAWKAIASLADRLTEPDAVTVLTLLDGYIQREPNHYRYTDDDHVAAVARIYDSHPSLAPRAADHLAQLVLQDFNLSETVRRAAHRSIVDPELLLDALRPYGPSHDAAARILDDYGEQTTESLERVAQRIDTVLNAPPPEPGHYAFGTDLPNLAQRTRGLDLEARNRLVEYCMSLAENESRPTSNRSEGMEGVLLLARSVDEVARAALFDRTLPLARLDRPPTSVDLMLSGGNHPLSSFQFDLDNGALSRFALQAAALLASSREQAQAVQDRAISWLAGDEQAINAVAHALDMLDPTLVTIDLAVLAEHPSQWLRQIAALLASRSIPPSANVLRALATDDDRHVRWNVAHLLSRIADSDKTLASELRNVLRADPSWMVRKAASTDLPAESINS